MCSYMYVDNYIDFCIVMICSYVVMYVYMSVRMSVVKYTYNSGVAKGGPRPLLCPASEIEIN